MDVNRLAPFQIIFHIFPTLDRVVIIVHVKLVFKVMKI